MRYYKFFKFDDMTYRQAIGVWWYSNVKRHWHNWRLKRMFEADPTRPRYLPKAGGFTPEAYRWALDMANAEIEQVDVDH